MRLRWELSKTWGKPLHDPVFDEIPGLHWHVYAHLLMEDKKQHLEEERDKIEYLARFWDNKAVNEIQRIRASQEQGPSDNEFETVLLQNFGKGLGTLINQQMTVEELGAQIQQANR